MKFIIATSSSAMICIRTTLLALILTRIVSGATLPPALEVSTTHTGQVQAVLKIINSLVNREAEERSVGRHLNAGQEVEESYFSETPRVKDGQEVAVRGARQAGEMIGSFLGSGLDEVLSNIRPLVTEILGPFMTTLGMTLLEWLSYTNPTTKAATSVEDSKTEKQIIFDAFEVDFPEYGKFLVLGEQKGNAVYVKKEDENEDDMTQLVEDEKERRQMLSRNFNQLDSRFDWIKEGMRYQMRR